MFLTLLSTSSPDTFNPDGILRAVTEVTTSAQAKRWALVKYMSQPECQDVDILTHTKAVELIGVVMLDKETITTMIEGIQRRQSYPFVAITRRETETAGSFEYTTAYVYADCSDLPIVESLHARLEKAKTTAMHDKIHRTLQATPIPKTSIHCQLVALAEIKLADLRRWLEEDFSDS